MKHGVFERRQWSKSRNVAEEPVNGDRVAGDWLWELPSAEEVVARVERCPNPMPAPSEIEIRRIRGPGRSGPAPWPRRASRQRRPRSPDGACG